MLLTTSAGAGLYEAIKLYVLPDTLILTWLLTVRPKFPTIVNEPVARAVDAPVDPISAVA